MIELTQSVESPQSIALRLLVRTAHMKNSSEQLLAAAKMFSDKISPATMLDLINQLDSLRQIGKNDG
jgi:hypothetical protein